MKLSEKCIDQIAKKLWAVFLHIPEKCVDADWKALDKFTRSSWWAMVQIVCDELQPEDVERSLAMRKEFGSLDGRQRRVQPAKSCSIVDGKRVCK
jgi:hypothetical protein